MSIATLLTSAPVSTWSDLRVHSIVFGAEGPAADVSSSVRLSKSVLTDITASSGGTYAIPVASLASGATIFYGAAAAGNVTLTPPTVAALTSYLVGLGLPAPSAGVGGGFTMVNRSSHNMTLDASADANWITTTYTTAAPYVLGGGESAVLSFKYASATTANLIG